MGQSHPWGGGVSVSLVSALAAVGRKEVEIRGGKKPICSPAASGMLCLYIHEPGHSGPKFLAHDTIARNFRWLFQVHGRGINYHSIILRPRHNIEDAGCNSTTGSLLWPNLS